MYINEKKMDVMNLILGAQIYIYLVNLVIYGINVKCL